MAKKNKDHLLNIRISRETYESLKKEARENSLNVSEFVRTMLRDGIDVVRDFGEDLIGENDNKKDRVVTYQEAKLAKDCECDECGADLEEGKKVVVGETKRGTRYYFCTKCAE